VTERGESVEAPVGEAAAPGGGESLSARLRREMTEAMKARDADRLSALRMLAAAVKNEEVRPEVLHALDDEEFRVVASREVKRRKEAAEAFAAAGRQERADRELTEAAVLEAYLPAALSEAELDAIVNDSVTEAGATGPKDFGAVMRLAMGRAKGRADGAAVQAKVRERLGG
jgi:uncharacterized protein YqeY